MRLIINWHYGICNLLTINFLFKIYIFDNLHKCCCFLKLLCFYFIINTVYTIYIKKNHNYLHDIKMYGKTVLI